MVLSLFFCQTATLNTLLEAFTREHLYSRVGIFPDKGHLHLRQSLETELTVSTVQPKEAEAC